MSHRRTFVKNSVLAAAACTLSNPLRMLTANASSSPGGNSTSLALLHTNDLHNSPAFKQVAMHIAGIRQKHPHTLLVDAGDVFSGDLAQRHLHHALTRQMQSAGYDAVLPGNRDYEAGSAYFTGHWENLRIPLVVSNYAFADNALKHLHQPYRVVHKGSVRIGIIGAGINLHRLVPPEVTGNIQYHDPVERLSNLATTLKNDKKCNLVICLSHLGLRNKTGPDDLQLAAKTKNIDAVIGAHSHNLMPAPYIVLNADGQEVIVNHAGHSGNALGSIHFTFDANGAKTMVQFNNLAIA